MQELERILEEIEKEKKKRMDVIRIEVDPMKIAINREQYKGLRMAEDIIRKHMNNGWISVDDRLPEEKINPVSQDFYEYQVTAKFEGLTDVRSYKFGHGHWWNGPGIVDKYVIAWRENPESYRPEQPETCKYTGGSCCWPINQCGECPNRPERSDNQ